MPNKQQLHVVFCEVNTHHAQYLFTSCYFATCSPVVSGCFPLPSGCFRLLFDSVCCVLDGASCSWLCVNCPSGGFAGFRCGFGCPLIGVSCLVCGPIISGGFWLLLGELVSHRGSFRCLLVCLACLLSCLGCSLGGLVCSFNNPGCFLPGFGWLPLRLLKGCAKQLSVF